MAKLDQESVEEHLHKEIKMGLGEAILRLIHVENYYSTNLGLPEELAAEREMIVAALNQYDLDLGFDCNADGVPDDVSIFEQSAATSCCRILPVGGDNSRKRKRGSSRKKRG